MIPVNRSSGFNAVDGVKCSRPVVNIYTLNVRKREPWRPCHSVLKKYKYTRPTVNLVPLRRIEPRLGLKCSPVSLKQHVPLFSTLNFNSFVFLLSRTRKKEKGKTIALLHFLLCVCQPLSLLVCLHSLTYSLSLSLFHPPRSKVHHVSR